MITGNRHYLRQVDQQLRMTHDPEANAAFIYVVDDIAPGEVAQTRLLHHDTPHASVICHYDSEKRLLGIELLGFSYLVPEAVVTRVDPNKG